MSDLAAYMIDQSTIPPICLPTAVYERIGELTDVTTSLDDWRRYIEVGTNRLHDGTVYARQIQALLDLQSAGELYESEKMFMSVKAVRLLRKFAEENGTFRTPGSDTG